MEKMETKSNNNKRNIIEGVPSHYGKWRNVLIKHYYFLYIFSLNIS